MLSNSADAVSSLACIACMISHDDPLPYFSCWHQSWLGSRQVMQLHENRPMKSLGVAGIAFAQLGLGQVYVACQSLAVTFLQYECWDPLRDASKALEGLPPSAQG